MFIALLRQIAQIFTWFVVVAPWEQALRVRLGKGVCKLGPGIFLRIPFVDRIFKQTTRRRLRIIRPQTLTTTDGKVVTCCGALGFSIGDLELLYNTLESPNDTLENEVAGIVACFIGERTLAECTAPALEEFVRGKLDLTKYGLAGQEFYATSFATTSKTYRLIMGEMGSWHADGQMSMAESVSPSNVTAQFVG